MPGSGQVQTIYAGSTGGAGGAGGIGRGTVISASTVAILNSQQKNQKREKLVYEIITGVTFVPGHELGYIYEPYDERFVWECECNAQGKKTSAHKTEAQRLHAEHALRTRITPRRITGLGGQNYTLNTKFDMAWGKIDEFMLKFRYRNIAFDPKALFKITGY